MKKSTAKKLLKLNYDLYEYQAQSFSDTRKEMWEKEVLDFVADIPAGSSTLDLGCGNGRLLPQLINVKFKSKNHSLVLQNIGIDYFGIDSSKKLIFDAKNKYNVCVSPHVNQYKPATFKVGDGLTMKFRNRFDCIICHAVLHHIPSEKLQLRFLNNIYRALKPNGKVLISVWNRWSDRYKKYFIQEKPFSDMKYSDIIVPWKQTKYRRYIHAFKSAELKSLAQKAGFRNIRCFASKHGVKTNLKNALNIYLIGTK